MELFDKKYVYFIMIDNILTLMHASITLEIAELAQCGAVVEKMINTIQKVEE
jgi:hypothetical protein